MSFRIRTLSSLTEIDPAIWNSCANPQNHHANPFLDHAFLLALEQSGSATPKTGWAAQHLILENQAGSVVGVTPCYLKSHSQGEYVFDHGWADAFHRAGGAYYPKLQVSVPFTPATGPRLLAATPEHRAALSQGLLALCSQLETSSVHVTFMEKSQAEASGPEWLQRQDIQFHWHNAGYLTFDDFLGTLSSGKRKNIRKERKAVAEAGITFIHATGPSLTTQHWDRFYDFYMDTGARKWGQPYLTRKFFSQVHATMAKDVLLILAMREGRIIAGALNFIGGDALYGRNWGASEHHQFLHFETCYYQAIDFAIAQKLNRVEAGAQGEHKLARGYMPVKTHSIHHLSHPGLQRAVAQYLVQERAAIDENQQELAEHAPYKHEEGR